MLRIYYFFLWLFGFAKGERITDMLKRTKRRIGIWWWLGLTGITGSFIWLVLHILEIS